MVTVLLLLVSNIFMTLAWYGHLKFPHLPMIAAIFIGWGIALLEYCFAVPANRLGYTHGFSGGQLKIIQEVVTLTVFAVFAAGGAQGADRLALSRSLRVHRRSGGFHVRGAGMNVPGEVGSQAFSSVHCSGCWFSRAKSMTWVTLVSATS